MSEQLATEREKAAVHDQKVSDLTARAVAAETSLLKNRVAHENGIPLELAARLTGDTEEEIKKDAEVLSQYFGNTTKTTPPLHSTDPSTSGSIEDAQAAAYRAVLSQLTTQS